MMYSFLFLSSILCTYFLNKVIVECSNTHESLNEELGHLGNVDFTDGNYEIVQFWQRNIKFDNENGKEFRFKRSGEEVTLKLKKSSIIRYKTPIWLVHSDDVINKVDDNIIYDVIQFYEDPVLFNVVAHDLDHWGQAYFRVENVNTMPRHPKGKILIQGEKSLIQTGKGIILIGKTHQFNSRKRLDSSPKIASIKPENGMNQADFLALWDWRDFIELGSIDGKNVAPISDGTARLLRKKRADLFEETLEPGSVDESGEFTLSKYHVMFAPRIPETKSIILPSMGTPELFRKLGESYDRPSYKRLKRSKADIIYPEILLILDYDRKFSSTEQLGFLHLISYTINFWNSVNLRFKTLKNPEVRLRIAGIVVSMERRALPFIKNNIEHSGMLNARKVIDAAPAWAMLNIPLSWDLVITQTNAILRGSSSTNIGGLAFLYGGCDGYEKQKMSGIINDEMDYSGIRPAAHEIGHILGTGHDISKSDNCTDTNGYIMSWNSGYVDHQFEWSPCSKRSISRYLRHKELRCYDNDNPQNDEGELVDSMFLPGDYISTRTQCRRRGFPFECGSIDICRNLGCTWTFWHCADTGAPLDGTPCPGGRCQNGECVSKN